MSFAKCPGKDTPQCYVKPLDSLKNWNNRFFWIDERVFPPPVDWRTSAPQDEKLSENQYSAEDVAILNSHRTMFVMDLFSLIRIPDPKVKVGTRPRAAHKVPLLQATANRVIDMGEIPAASASIRTPSATEQSPLDFYDADVETEVANEDPIPATSLVLEQSVTGESTMEIPKEANAQQDMFKAEPPVPKKRRRRDKDEAGTSALLKMSRADARLTHPEEAMAQDVFEPEPISYAAPRPTPNPYVTQSSKVAADEEEGTEKSLPFDYMGGPPDDTYQPKWGITNKSCLDDLQACQEFVDHAAPPGCFSELRHLPAEDFLSQYNLNLARQIALGSQLRLRYKQESKLLKKSVAKVERRDQKIQAQTEKLKNLETLIEAESDMRKATEAKTGALTKELEDLRVRFSKLQADNSQLSQQVMTLQTQVAGEEKIKAAFEEYKKAEHEMVGRRCAEMDARLDSLSVDFDEELYPHMLTAIAGRRWMISYGLRLTVMKCAESVELRQAFADVVTAGIAKGISEGLSAGIEHGKAGLEATSLEGYDPKASEKFTAALQALRDLKHPLVDELETEGCSNRSHHGIPTLRGRHWNPWVIKEEMLLEDAIAANVSRAERKKKSRVGLQVVLADATTQTEQEEGRSPRRLTRTGSSLLC
ncbi:hypothetical protein Tco_0805922 [Tanacetum coccineum]